MQIWKIEKFINDTDSNVVERRTNEGTGEISYYGMVEIPNGLIVQEVGAFKLQSTGIYSAVNEWRLKQPIVLAQIFSKIKETREKEKPSFFKGLLKYVKKDST